MDGIPQVLLSNGGGHGLISQMVLHKKHRNTEVAGFEVQSIKQQKTPDFERRS